MPRRIAPYRKNAPKGRLIGWKCARCRDKYVLIKLAIPAHAHVVSLPRSYYTIQYYEHRKLRASKAKVLGMWYQENKERRGWVLYSKGKKVVRGPVCSSYANGFIYKVGATVAPDFP